jgi:hypothetical protein
MFQTVDKFVVRQFAYSFQVFSEIRYFSAIKHSAGSLPANYSAGVSHINIVIVF